MYFCANIIYKPANMFEYRSIMFLLRTSMCTSLKVTHTYPLRTYPCSLAKTCTFSENSPIFLSYFCEQLPTPPKRCACMCFHDNIMAETHMRLCFIEVYLLLACTYVIRLFIHACVVLKSRIHLIINVFVICFYTYIIF
jgi:hypothetical protein